MGFTSKHTGAQIEAYLDSVPNKQDKLVSGQNIKTINGQDVLGEGDITIEAGGDTTSLEKIVAAGITDLDLRVKKLVGTDEAIKADITSLEGNITTLENEKATKAEVKESDDNITSEMISNERVTAASLNEMWLKITDIITRLEALENK